MTVQDKGLSVEHEPWREDIARDAYMEALSCLDVAEIARRVRPTEHCPEASRRRAEIANAEFCKHIDDLMESVREMLWSALHSNNAPAQREALKWAKEATREAWLRLDIMTPAFAISRAKDVERFPKVFRHGASFTEEVAAEIATMGTEMLSMPAGTGERRWQIEIRARFPGTAREIIEHFARLAGSPLPATPSETVRFARGLVTASTVTLPFVPPPRTPLEAWRYLRDTADDLRSNPRLIPLRSLGVFYETAYHMRIGPVVRAKLNGTGSIPSIEGLAPDYLDAVDHLDLASAKRNVSEMLVDKALQVLGHPLDPIKRGHRKSEFDGRKQPKNKR